MALTIRLPVRRSQTIAYCCGDIWHIRKINTNVKVSKYASFLIRRPDRYVRRPCREADYPKVYGKPYHAVSAPDDRTTRIVAGERL